MLWQGPATLYALSVIRDISPVRLGCLRASRAILAAIRTVLGASTAIFVGLGKCLDELPKES